MIKIIKKPKYISPTQILTYKHGGEFKYGCPRKYYYKYILRLKQKPKLCFSIGNLVHHTIDEFCKTPLEGDLIIENQVYDSLLEKIVAIFNRRWFAAKSEIARFDESPGEIKNIYLECRLMIRNWFENYYIGVIEHYYKCGDWVQAVRKAMPLSELGVFAKSLRLYARIDSVDDRDDLIITDYKTGNKRELTPEIRLQLALCALAYLEKYEKKPDIVRAHFLKYEDGILSLPVTDEMIQQAKNAIKDHEEMILSESEIDYPCVCNNRCKYDFIIPEKNGKERTYYEDSAKSETLNWQKG